MEEKQPEWDERKRADEDWARDIGRW